MGFFAGCTCRAAWMGLGGGGPMGSKYLEWSKWNINVSNTLGHSSIFTNAHCTLMQFWGIFHIYIYICIYIYLPVFMARFLSLVGGFIYRCSLSSIMASEWYRLHSRCPGGFIFLGSFELAKSLGSFLSPHPLGAEPNTLSGNLETLDTFSQSSGYLGANQLWVS